MQRVIEALESRIAPAAVFTYTEQDGDTIVVKTTAAISNAEFEALAIFDEGSEDVNLLELNLNDPVFHNSSLTISVSATGAEGNGLASIGRIDAGVDLKSVIINGDLEAIYVGDSNRGTPALGKLQVQNLGSEAGYSSYVNGNAKSVKILGDLTSDIYNEGGSFKSISIGGSITDAGEIYSGRIGSLLVGGNVTGAVYSDSIKTVRITGNLGSADSESEDAGVIYGDRIKAVKIGGSIIGGNGDYSGGISAEVIGSVVVAGNLEGGAGAFGGYIYADDELGKVVIQGNVLGGTGDFSGQIGSEEEIGSVRIVGDLVGGLGENSGSIAVVEYEFFEEEFEEFIPSYYPTGSIEKITIGGSIIGGGELLGEEPIGGFLSGQVVAEEIGSIRVGANLQGGVGIASGSIFAFNLESAYIGGSILGGSGENSGNLAGGGLGSVRVIENVVGGTGSGSGSIFSEEGIGSVKIGGALIGDADESGSISSGGTIDSITIGAGISNIGEGITGIYAYGSIGKIAITGDVTGAESGLLGIRAGFGHSSSTSVASIGSVSIKGNATNLLIEAGVNFDGEVNPDARIGSVNITGSFTASSIAAGMNAGLDGYYGTADDVAPAEGDLNVVSRIASVVIGGNVVGTDGGVDGYGIFAQHLVSVKVAGAKLALNPNPNDDLIGEILDGTDDFRVAESSVVPVVEPV